MPNTPDTNPVVIDTSRSPHARLRPVPVNAVTLTDTFWAPRLEINRTVTIPSQYRQCEDTGRLDNFRRVSGKTDNAFEGIFFNDSDVYKWLEAASWALATHPDDTVLRPMIDAAITEIAGAQQPDGYLNTYFSLERAGERWTNLRDMHELYCAGHFFQAAVAHHRATGETSALDIARRFADNICAYFGPADQGKHPGTDGHEEVEMALVELYRATGERRYLEQAQYFIDARGSHPSALIKKNDPRETGDSYHQDHVPFRDLSEVIGHAVRMIYLDCGATDLYTETGEAALKAALERQWANMTERRMYVTGGLGARHEGEAFGKDYELPSDRAYAETCAAIASVMWNYRMLQATGEARYADLMELALYNGVLSGLSLDGTEYFYVNPLADDGTHRRQPWFGCACCPPNVARLLASLPGYFYGTSEDAVWVHLYASGTANVTLPSGGQVVLRQETNYPWDGEITLTVVEAPERPVALHLRIPAWAGDGATITLNGGIVGVDKPTEYVPLAGLKAGDKVVLTLPMQVRRIESHPFVADSRGCVALMRGPLVYCLEQTDHPDTDLRKIVLLGHSKLTEQFQPDLLGGMVTIQGKAAVILSNPGLWTNKLYETTEELERDRTPAGQTTLTAIPYYAWANREPGAMRVWISVA